MEIRNLSNEQRKAIRRSKQIGLTIQTMLPEVADNYRSGSSLEDIVDMHNIQRMFRVPRRIAVTAVDSAIIGHVGGFSVPAYHGLIEDPDELDRLWFEHKSSSGKYTYQHKIGVYARTKRQMEKDGRKGGTLSGNQHKANGTGICGMTREELREAGIKSAESRGFIPWVPRINTGKYYIPAEIEYAYSLSQEPKYRIGSKVNMKKIAVELNITYHGGLPVRNGTRVKVALQRYSRNR